MMKSLRGLLLVMLGLLSFSVFAATDKTTLNNISFQITANRWVKSNTALVVVAANAAVKQGDLVTTRENLLNKLQKIAKTDWHVTMFNRSQDQSGLQRIQMQAQARLPIDQLANINKSINDISQAGQKFSLVTMNFMPSAKLMQRAEGKLRHKIYVRAANEIKRLNKVYDDQTYFLHSINFVPANRIRTTALFVRKTPGPAASPSLNVSRQVFVTANITLSSKVGDKDS